ncbi:MAG: Asp-tRNA(Asn)/Glu-tRNA(Gln) amidotransferase subunit GatC [Firmicutes bacterium]|nr:Asp-tRNA(Asn)/Glu-tRNA(Gln) amidotransferase subunit GatC [Bacillota bacterium]
MITTNDINRIAALARLELDSSEQQQFARQLQSVLEYSQVLKAMDSGSVKPTTTTCAYCCPLRPDRVEPGLEIGETLALAPEHKEGRHRVPPVMEVE